MLFNTQLYKWFVEKRQPIMISVIFKRHLQLSSIVRLVSEKQREREHKLDILSLNLSPFSPVHINNVCMKSDQTQLTEPVTMKRSKCGEVHMGAQQQQQQQKKQQTSQSCQQTKTESGRFKCFCFSYSNKMENCEDA